MKRIIVILLIFYCNFVCGASSYECTLRELWNTTCAESGAEDGDGFLQQDIQVFFEKSAEALRGGEKTLIFFYPKNCGFDRLVVDDEVFIGLEEFFRLAENYGFRITYCTSQRHLVSFSEREELEEFVKRVLKSELKGGEVRLYFPSKVIIAELTKN